MTAETLAAALLKGVPRNVALGADTPMLFEQHVLAALSRAMSDDLAERAGVVLEWLHQESKTGHPLLEPDRKRAADLITALLAQNAALRAERDIALGMYLRSSDEGFRQKDRAERLETALRLLHENVVLAFPALADLGPVANARAALKGADHER